MLLETRSRFLLQGFTLTLLGSIVHGDGNYPDHSEFKPCALKNASVQVQLAICIPNDKGGWRQDTVENCWHLDTICPEFNKAECLWLDFQPSKCNPPLPHPIKYPCCRVSYRARKYEWMEIFYTNQYGTSDRNDSVYDIVELHRHIRNKGNFSNSWQPDWPENVPDPQGERGLAWSEVDFNKVKVPRLTARVPICDPTSESQTLCTQNALAHIEALFNPFDGPVHIKLPVDNERSRHREEYQRYTYQIIANCSLALIEGTRTNVCKVTYTQGEYEYYEYDAPYMEAQVYYKPTGDQKAKTTTTPDTKKFTFSVRYTNLVTISNNDQYYL